VTKKIWDKLREAHEGIDEVREGKMDLLQGELEHFVMHGKEIMRQMYRTLDPMVLVSDIRSLESTEWDDHKVTKKLLRTFIPKNLTLATMIRRDPKFKTKTPNQFLGEILHQEMAEKDKPSHLATRSTRMSHSMLAQVIRLNQVLRSSSQRRKIQVMKVPPIKKWSLS
jgi:hypothetical protein